MKSKATLSLCMIVKNEEAFLKECLEQARPHCDELIVVDTGSTDQTQTIAESCGAKVFSYAWTNDFSAARNYSLQQASADWILVLDADERLDLAGWQKILRVIQADSVASCYSLAQVNYTFERALVGFTPNQFLSPGFSHYPGYMISSINRLFRNHSGFVFQGVVHENLTRVGKSLRSESLDVPIHHHGQALSPEKLKIKKQQYLELGKSKVAQNPNDGKAQYELGIAYWETGNLAQAVECFEASAKSQHHDIKNHIAWAAVLKLMGDVKAAEEKFREILKIDPLESSSHAGLAGCLKEQGRFDEAIAELQTQIKMHSDFILARQWLSDCYDEKIRTQPTHTPTLTVCYIVKNEADCLAKTLANIKPHVDEIIVLDTGSTDSTKEIAKNAGALVHEVKWQDDFSWARNESMKHATSEWILILDADEILGESDWQGVRHLISKRQALMYYLVQTTYSNIATVLHWQPNQLNVPEAAGYSGYFESPLVRLFRNTPQIEFRGAVHEHAHHKDPRVQAVLTMLRIHHYGKHRSDERMREKSDLYYRIGCQKLADMPNEPHAYYELAAQLMELGELDEVESYFCKALELDPNHADALLAYASFLSEKERYADALDLFVRLIKLKPEDPQAYIFTSTVLIRLKKYELALNLLETAKKFGADNAIALLMNEGVIHLQLGNIEEARRIFEHAFRVNPSFAPVLLNLGIVAMQMKNHHEAENYLLKAIALDPENDFAYQKLGELYFNTNHREKSLENFLMAEKLRPENTAILAQIIINAHALMRSELVQQYEKKLFSVLKKNPSKSLADEAVLRVVQLYKAKNDVDGIKRVSTFVESLA